MTKKVKVGLSANKVLATIFGNLLGIIHVGYLRKKFKIIGEYYAYIIGQVQRQFEGKRSDLSRKEVVLHLDPWWRTYGTSTSDGMFENLAGT